MGNAVQAKRRVFTNFTPLVTPALRLTVGPGDSNGKLEVKSEEGRIHVLLVSYDAQNKIYFRMGYNLALLGMRTLRLPLPR